MRRLVFYIGLLSIAALCSCTATKFVPEGEKLYTKPETRYVQAPGTSFKGVAENSINEILRPDPTPSILGSRPRLWIWYKASKPGEEADSGSWVKRKIGQAPVYLSETDPDAIVKAMNAALYNKGFFDSQASYQLVETEKTGTYIYTINLFPPYRIAALEWPADSSELNRAVLPDSASTLLKPGRRYDLDRIADERKRIDERLKDKGFFFFSDKFINYRMDTALGNRTVKLMMYYRREAPQTALVPYTIRRVNVYTNYSLSGDTIPYEEVVVDSVHFYQRTNYLRPYPIQRAIFFADHKPYSRTDHNLTLSRLTDLGVFRFVNVKLTVSDTLSRMLDANIQLTPSPRKAIGIEITGASKSNNFIGPALNVRFRNKNAMRGAELLIFNIATSFETQFSGPFRGQFTYEANPKVELYVPRFLLIDKPVQRMFKRQSMFVPKTRFSFDYSYISRVNYFNMQSIRFGYGYRWKPSLPVDHDIGLLNLTYFNIYRQSTAFQELLAMNSFLRRRFEKQFIEGITYMWMYNEQVKPGVKHPMYVGLNAELAGTFAWAGNGFRKSTDGTTHQLFGVNYAQFGRLEIDLRKFFKFDRRNRRMLATRFLAGWGYPFGNSTTMPYIRQFFSGGAYSVRGFPSFSLGPGTYYPPDSLRSGFYLQQGGEVKLEANAEYRFSFTRIFKGAFFADAGNTWLNNRNAELPGAEFRTSDFYRQTAVSIGLGFRVDIEFFVIRLDLGMPVRKPWLPDGDRWVFDDIDFGNATWRRENLVLNLAFGYPF